MAYDFTSVNVLIVESTTQMYKLFRDVLHMLGIPEKNIFAAYTTDEAFSLFQRSEFDLIITDWLQSPNRGIELIKRIRTDPKSKDQFIPIIMTAGSGHYSRVIKSRDAGVNEYLVKPFAASALAMRITRVIEKPRPFVVSASYTGPDRRVRDLPFEGQDRRKAVQEFEVEV